MAIAFDADDVARADTARRGYHQSLKGADRLGVAGFFVHDANRLPEQTELNSLAADGEVSARREQQDDEQIAVHQVVQCPYQTCKAVIKCI